MYLQDGEVNWEQASQNQQEVILSIELDIYKWCKKKEGEKNEYSVFISIILPHTFNISILMKLIIAGVGR